LHNNDIVINNNKEEKILVPILKEENLGSNMAIDEKNIWWEIYTILSNRDTWKIALLAMTVKENILKKLLGKLPKNALDMVKRVTMDLDKWFERVIKWVFSWVKVIGDKFHVICLGLDALQSVRIRYRQEVLREERIRRNSHIEEENIRRNELERLWKNYKRKNLPSMKRYENWESKLEILARSRYFLFKYRDEWTLNQKERSKILFREFPEIEKAYKLICSFRSFYNCSYGNVWDKKKADNKLKEWIKKTDNCNISEIDNFVSTIENNKEKILTYFDYGETNAYAESLNNRIQRFVHQNYWVKNLDFFHFRIKKIFG